MIKRFLHGCIFVFFGFSLLFSTFAIVIEVPSSQGQNDVIVTGPTQIQADEGTLFATIQNVNNYLWFFIGAVCMGVLIFGGIKLITANGDSAKMKEANKLLMGAIIGIFISIFSYALVRIIVNLIV